MNEECKFLTEAKKSTDTLAAEALADRTEDAYLDAKATMQRDRGLLREAQRVLKQVQKGFVAGTAKFANVVTALDEVAKYREVLKAEKAVFEDYFKGYTSVLGEE